MVRFINGETVGGRPPHPMMVVCCFRIYKYIHNRNEII